MGYTGEAASLAHVPAHWQVRGRRCVECQRLCKDARHILDWFLHVHLVHVHLVQLGNRRLCWTPSAPISLPVDQCQRTWGMTCLQRPKVTQRMHVVKGYERIIRPVGTYQERSLCPRSHSILLGADVAVHCPSSQRCKPYDGMQNSKTPQRGRRNIGASHHLTTAIRSRPFVE